MKYMYHVSEFTDLVSLLFAAPVPIYTSYFSEILATCSCTFFIIMVYFSMQTIGIYEELFVRTKKNTSVA